MSETVDEQITIHVECYSGYRGEETPVRFVVGEHKVEVTDIVDRWIAPDHRYFKVTGDDGFTYLLRHDVWDERWCLAGEGGSEPGGVS